MLLRVRDEIRMTIAAYQTLFESSMAYGMRKVLLGDQGKNECSRQVCCTSLIDPYYRIEIDGWFFLLPNR